jgi:MoaA/NifB/PqqE/SkfB family radical SAM enzyme
VSGCDRAPERERAAGGGRRWIRLTTACNSDCLFCLDSGTPRERTTPLAVVRESLERGRGDGADKVVLSGGEGTLHPDYLEIVRAARDLGYTRVQAVSNGWKLADPGFFDRCVAAGLDEMTFSLHGHDAALHERLTRTPGSFRRIVKAIARAARDPRVVCNIDVVLCRPNVEVLDRIVELGISLGVTEFDLLHVIPQGRAWEHREALLYDPAEHLESLRRVFRLARHPGYVVWTNRLPAPWLEGLEELIQDPAKLHDEVRGRRQQLRRYLDEGTPLDCREPDRCAACFLEPLCTSADRLTAGLSDGTLQLVDGARTGLRRVARRADQLEAWLGAAELDIELNRETAAWLLAHRERLKDGLERVWLRQPGHERLQDAQASDVREPAAFFEELGLPIRCSGLPACLAPGAVLVDEPPVVRRELVDPGTGRLRLRPLVDRFIRRDYRVQSLRCRACRLRDRCPGLHVNMARDQGFALLSPLSDGSWVDEAERQLAALHPDPDARLATGRAPEPPHPDLRSPPRSG